MSKGTELLKHLRVLIPQVPLKNRKTGQCTRWINSAENKAYSGPKILLCVSDGVSHVGKEDELLTVAQILCPLCPYNDSWISFQSKKMRSYSVSYRSFSVNLNFLGWADKHLGG